MQRYFSDKCVEKLEYDCNTEIYYHLTKVLRCKVSTNVEICDNKGRCYLYEVISIDANKIVFNQIEELTKKTELDFELVLIVSLLKNSNFELVLQKAVELGVTTIIPLETSRTIVKSSNFKANKFDRFNKIVLEAAEQSKRCLLPKILPVCKIDDLKNLNYENMLVAYEVTKSCKSLFKKLSETTGDYAIVIGPEGGFSKEEITRLNSFGFECVSLGSRILRAETAAISAIGVISTVKDTN